MEESNKVENIKNLNLNTNESINCDEKYKVEKNIYQKDLQIQLNRKTSLMLEK